MFEGDLAQVGVGVIVRRPVPDRQRLVHHGHVRRASGLHGGEIDERLPRRAGLAVGVGGPVVGAGGIVEAAQHGPHPTGAVQRHQGGLFDVLGLVSGDGGARGLGGPFLHRQVQGGLDHQILPRRAHQPSPLAVEPVDEILRRRRWRGLLHPDDLSERLGPACRRDRASLEHGVEHQLGALAGLFRCVGGIVRGGGFHHPGKDRRLPKGQARGRLAEIALGGRLDAIGSSAEVDPAEIQSQDFPLGVLPLQLHGQHQFLGLALHRAVGGEEQVARQLLGDR